MRLSIRAKQIAGVTALVGSVVVALSALYVTRLAQVVLHEGQARGQMLANAILDRAREVAATGEEARAALVGDDGLQAILKSSLYGENVTDASILDRHGVVIASSDPGLIGRRLPERVDIGALVQSSPLTQLRAIYRPRDGQYVEVREPLRLGTEDFGSVRVASSTLLMRDELNKALEPALYTAAAALLVSVFVALLLAQVLLRPIHVIRSGLTRLGRGEFGVTLDLPPGDEFGELGSFFNAVSQQLSADRLLLAGQKANLQSAVEHLEDGVALFNASGRLLFSNPAMQGVLPPDAVGRPIEKLLPAGHVYRRIVEETLATGRSNGPVEARDDQLLMGHAVAGTDGKLIGVLLVSRNLGYLSRMQSTLAYSRKLVALGRLTAGIAHEVKNPLNAMMIHLELLRTKIARAALHPVPAGALPAAGPGESDTVQAGLEHIEIIEKEIRRLDEVVQGFLKFTRPEELRLQPVALGTIVEEIVPVVQPEADRNRVRVVIDAPASLPKVNGDAAMLRQALLNLAINACQAMPDGGTLRIG
ncbi:MAG TPA: histidine kinase dimerization/phospho-acceptor domain-containing protein, partial [Vicinamibacterales bacterium]|nr:histidine kinase dimerization/phospho-acceptor domain-containing protein [Vicinamibacterales bacterium]